MSAKVAVGAESSHPVFPDIGRPRMANADVRNPDVTWNERIGAAIQRAVLKVFETNKAAARTLGVDDAEFGKWLSGARRPQFDLLFAYPPLQKPLVLSLAKLAGARVSERVEFPEDVE